MNVVEQWYRAWTTPDKTKILSLLHPTFFGLRFYDETVCYETGDVEPYVTQFSIESYTITNLFKHKESYQYSIDIVVANTTHHVDGKLVVKNDKIYKLYERIQSNTTRYKVICSYDGSAFFGFQTQPNVMTIQGSIEHAIQIAFKLDSPLTIHASGRTDKGVHAINQVFHFDLRTKVPVNKIGQLIQAELPSSIFIKAVSIADPTFHSRYDVISKTYQYNINISQFDPIQRQYEWYVESLNLGTLQTDALVLLGTHDFQSFTKQSNRSTIRTIHDISIEHTESHVQISITGSGFLRYMVRYIIYALVQNNTGALSCTLQDLLAKKDVSLLKEMAPAGGLYLYQVRYE